MRLMPTLLVFLSADSHFISAIRMRRLRQLRNLFTSSHTTPLFSLSSGRWAINAQDTAVDTTSNMAVG
jgi:hypothetical protein